ncbi:MAG TPA: hypothetical protein VKA95_06485 [Nitrososphaeraceae archaeon]|nr:hypothetical protein [Nitrososphaeraceae archaeon]
MTGGAGFIGSNLANVLAVLDLEQIKQDKKVAKEIETKSTRGEDMYQNNYVEQNNIPSGNSNEVIAIDDLSLGSA